VIIELRPHQELLDKFYTKHGPCCAGCDWWHHINSLVGECRRSAPVAATERLAMIGIAWSSLPPAGAGHIMTTREHHCGDFKDDFDWSTLPPWYLRRIGRTATPPSDKD
jgi:hypothetical protein